MNARAIRLSAAHNFTQHPRLVYDESKIQKKAVFVTVSESVATLYATPTYLVNHRVLSPGATIELPGAQSTGVWLPITPGLSQNGEAVRIGTPIKWSTQQKFEALTNQSNGSVEIIEVVFTTVPNSRQKPLAEITETRPWGSFTVLSDAPHFKLKQLWVEPGNRLSLQRHQKREEHWFITAGKPEITLNDQTLHSEIGDYIHIPFQAWHRLANPAGNEAGVEIIEIQLGSYFGEDDIERQSDDYGRQ